MNKVVLFSPNGYVGGYIKEKIQSEKNIQLYEITRGSKWEECKENYDTMIYSAAVRYATAEKYIQDNVVSAISVVNFCRENNIKRIIYLSSDEIYGELNTNVVNEKAIMINPGLYGTTKYLAEKIIMDSGIPYYILRMPGIVGRTWGKTFLYRLMDSIKNNESIELYNWNGQFNNVVDIDDLTRFIVLLINCVREESEIFLLGNTEQIELKELVSYIKEMYHSVSQISNVDTKSKRYFTLDVRKAVEYGYLSKNIKTIINELHHIQES